MDEKDEQNNLNTNKERRERYDYNATNKIIVAITIITTVITTAITAGIRIDPHDNRT
jgi:hypothetical protein